MGIKENLQSLNLSNNVKIIAVTKKVRDYQILEAINYGVTDIGESYVQEAEDKFCYVGRKVKWHLIGHLQSNKIKTAVRIFDVIQSVDSLKLAKKLAKEAKNQEKILDIMLQVNISGDKNGFEPEIVLEAIKKLSKFRYLNVIGLMAIGNTDNPELSFKKMNNLFKKSKLKYLSLGMSRDYKLALNNGSNMVRLGAKIFGPKIQ